MEVQVAEEVPVLEEAIPETVLIQVAPTVDGTGIKSNSTVMDGNTVGTSSSAPVTESATAYNLNVDEDPAAARSLSLGGMNAPVLIILILLILACAAELIKRSKRDIK